MSNFSDLFYSSETVVEKKSLSVPTKDYIFIKEVFPEWGTPNCLTVFCFQLIAQRLRERGINTYHDRTAQGFTIEQLKNLIKNG